MACCLYSFTYLKDQLNNCFINFDNYLNKILEIEIKDDSDKEYNLIDLNEINNNKDHTIIDIPIDMQTNVTKDMPINKGYNII